MKQSHSAARARTADPSTSHAAAAGQTEPRITATMQRVLQCFKLYGDMTDTTLARNLNQMERDAGMTKLTSPSGARSRRKDLSRANEERLMELRMEWYKDNGLIDRVDIPVNVPDVSYRAADEWARRTLRLEGVRSPLWPTGAFERLQSGYNAIVWGVAQ